MTNLTLVVDNADSVEFKIIQTLKDHHGKFVSVACALRNVEKYADGVMALRNLVNKHLVESETNLQHGFTLVRYRSELALLRKVS